MHTLKITRTFLVLSKRHQYLTICLAVLLTCDITLADWPQCVRPALFFVAVLVASKYWRSETVVDRSDLGIDFASGRILSNGAAYIADLFLYG